MSKEQRNMARVELNSYAECKNQEVVVKLIIAKIEEDMSSLKSQLGKKEPTTKVLYTKEELIDKKSAMEDKLKQARKKTADTLLMINEKLDELGGIHEKVLRLYYIEDISLTKTANALSYSIDRINHIHLEGLLEYSKIASHSK